jgi:hypothetical protein
MELKKEKIVRINIKLNPNLSNIKNSIKQINM